MIKFIPFKGFGYEKSSSYAEYVNEHLEGKGFDLINLGASSDENMDVYGIKIGDFTKPTMYFEGTIHGAHEWRCAHWMARFADILNNPKDYPIHRSEIERLKSTYSFFIIPNLNPAGYQRNSYTNQNSVNLNRNFDYYWENEPVHNDYRFKGDAPFSEPETQIVRDVIQKYKPFVFVDTHTWGGYYGSTIKVESSARRYRILQRQIFDSYILSDNGFDGDFSVYNSPRPSSADWAGVQPSKNGISPISFLFESGSLETEYNQAQISINAMYSIALHADKYFEKRIQNIIN